jgi:hypothetical protein
MPITYEIDKSHRIIRTSCAGAVTIDEVIDHFHVLEQDPDCPDRANVLLDVCEETSVPTSDNLRQVTFEINRISKRVQFDTCAVVACTDELYGMLRMFQVFTESYFRETYVFRTTGEAEAWLASHQPTTSAAG